MFIFKENEIQEAIIKQGKVDVYEGLTSTAKKTVVHLHKEYPLHKNLKNYVQTTFKDKDEARNAIEIIIPKGRSKYVDILGKSGKNDVYIIELKRTYGTKEGLDQLVQYYKLLEDKINDIRKYKITGPIQLPGAREPFAIPTKPNIHGILAALDFNDERYEGNRAQDYMPDFMDQNIDLAYISIETYKGKRAIKHVSLILYKDF